MTTTLELTASAAGARLSLTWTNAGPAAVRVPTHVFAGEKHFDWVTVKLADRAGATRTLVFTDNRDESGAVLVDLPPGASTTETIDLAGWAMRAANGGQALSPGVYRAHIVYDTGVETRGWVGHLEADTSVEVP